MTYKQPHEGVTGVDRDDDLLSLDETAIAHRDALIAMSDHLQSATLVGDPAPIVRRMSQRIRSPQVGDLVVEQSRGAFNRDVDTRVKAFGYLVEKRVEWGETDEEWAEIRAEDPSAERWTDTAWYIQYGSAAVDICRWTNCSFIVVPIDPSVFREQVGTRDGTGVVITRDDLLGSLADSGFKLNIE